MLIYKPTFLIIWVLSIIDAHIFLCYMKCVGPVKLDIAPTDAAVLAETTLAECGLRRRKRSFRFEGLQTPLMLYLVLADGLSLAYMVLYIGRAIATSRFKRHFMITQPIQRTRFEPLPNFNTG